MNFVINLNPKGNKWSRYALVNNPFARRGDSPEEFARAIFDGLSNGVSKSIMPVYLKRLGLSEEVIDLLKSDLERDKSYEINISRSAMRVRRIH
jgi:hypothetical protein